MRPWDKKAKGFCLSLFYGRGDRLIRSGGERRDQAAIVARVGKSEQKRRLPIASARPLSFFYNDQEVVGRKNKKRKVFAFRFFMVEVTGLEPSSPHSALFSHRPAGQCSLSRSAAPLPENLASLCSLRFFGSPVKRGRGRGFCVRKNKKRKVNPFVFLWSR